MAVEGTASFRSDDALSAIPDEADPTAVIAAAAADNASIDLKQQEMTPATAVAAASVRLRCT